MTAPSTSLAQRLSPRDLAILGDVEEFRFLTTRQLSRLHFEGEPAGPIPRRANHALARLKSLGCLATLRRRIGGVRAGSAGHVWTLTNTGSRALASRRGRDRATRIRTYEPSVTFLEHTLAVAEAALVAREGARRGRFDLEAIKTEPAAWRPYVGPTGAVVRLKPDLAIVTETSGFEDHWFIEVDLDTEPPSRVISKSLAYERYRATGIEQRERGVFPAVVWLVPSPSRAAQLRAHLERDRRVSASMHAVITLDAFEKLLSIGLEAFQNNPGGQEGGEPS